MGCAGRRSGLRRADLAAAALALLTVAASRAIAATVFEEMPHLEDEFADLWQAEVMAGGRIAVASPPEPQSFLVPFVVDNRGMRFGKYPPGWPAALAIGAAADFPYWVNPLLAGLAVWLTYRLGSRLAGRGGGLLAALLTAVSPMILMLSGTLMPHMLTTVLALTFALAWFDLFVPKGLDTGSLVPRGLLLAAAGLSMGLLLITRPWTGVAVALPFAIHGLVLVATRRRSTWTSLATIGGLSLAVALLLPVWQWAQTGDPWLNPYILYWPYDRIGFGVGIGVLPGGHTLHQAWINTRHSLWAWQQDLFGWPFLSWIFLPVGLGSLRRRVEAWIGVGVFASLVLLHLAYWVGSWLLGPRYFVEAVPFLAAISACGIGWAGGWVGRRARAVPLRRLGVAAVVALLIMGDLGLYLPRRVGGLHGLFGITRSALEAFQAVNPGRGLVIVRRNPAWHGYGNLLTLTPPFAESDLRLAYDRGPEINADLADLFPDRPTWIYDPADPGRLEVLDR